MKTFRKCTALLLSAVLLLSLLAVLPAVAAEDDIIEIGDGTDYANIRKYIDSGKNYEGKTFRLVSDITETVNSTKIVKSCNIDGNGHTISANGTVNTFYIFDASDTKSGYSVKNKLTAEIRNVHFTTTSTNAGFIGLYIRQHTNVTLTNCTTDQSICCLFALHNNGDCNLTIDSGVYWAKTCVFRANYYNVTEAAKSTVTVNNGFFGLAPTGSRCAGTVQVGLFGLDGYTNLTVNGGVFYSPVENPIIYQTLKISASQVSDEQLPTIHPTADLRGGTFYVPKGYSKLFGKWEAVTRGYTTFSVADSVRILQTAPVPVTVRDYSTIDVTPADLPFTAEANARLTLNGQTFAGLADGNLDGVASMMELTGNSNVTAVFAKTPVFKNGYRADGLTGDAVVQNFGETAGLQYRVNADGTYDVRIILAFTDEDCTAAEWTITNPENGKSETVPVTVCYRAFLAAEKTVTAADCGGTRLLIVSVNGLTDAQNGKTLTVCATLTAGDVSHTSRIFTVTIEKPVA